MMNLTSSKKYSLLLTITLLMATFVAVASVTIVAPASAQGDDWPMFMHDAAHTGASSSAAPASFIIGWKFKTEALVRSSPAIVGGKVYIGSDDWYLYCLDATSGSLVWKYRTAGGVFSSPAVVAGKVYVGSYDTYVYCLDVTSGSLVWKYKTGHFVLSSPTVVAGKVYVGSNDGKLYCLDAAAGTQVWNATIAATSSVGLPYSYGLFMVSPAVVAGKVYMGSHDRNVYCFNATTGSQIWKTKLGGDIYGSSPTVAYGKVWIGADDFYFYGLHETNGTIWMKYMFPEKISTTWLESTPAAANNKVYVGYPHALSCFDATTGLRLWWGRTGSAQKSSPAVADGKVYIGGQDSYFWCFDAASGKQLENMGKFAGAFQSAPAIVNGKVYVGGWDNYVYCFVAGTPTRISCWSDRDSLPLGETVYIRGGIVPAVSGATVILRYIKPDTTFVNETVTSGTDGSYENAFTPDMRGEWSVKATWLGSATYGAASSTSGAFIAPATFTVTTGAAPSNVTTTTISCTASPASVKVNEAVSVSGSISPAVSGVTVTLTITKPDATTTTKTVASASDGSFTDTFTPDVKGDWNVQSSWAGSATHTAATSTAATITVTEEAPAAGIPMEIIYAIVAVVVIAIVGVAAYMYMRSRKKK